LHRKLDDGDEKKLLYNLADIQDYLLKTDILLKLCSDIKDLNKLYRKSFKKIETYDEEEECTVTPDACNGYTFELYINSFFQFCDSNKFGVLMVERAEEYAPVSNQ
jgi:UDP-N-acetylglucosamine pyrophosphorylase